MRRRLPCFGRAARAFAIALAFAACGDSSRPCAEREAVIASCDSTDTMPACSCSPTSPDLSCEPNRVIACYRGRTSSIGVGACVAGSSRCLADGSGFTGCTGDVQPRMNLCSTSVDESCGAGLPCVDDTPFARKFTAKKGSTSARRAAVDAQGNILVLATSMATASGMPASTQDELSVLSTTSATRSAPRPTSMSDFAVEAKSSRVIALFAAGKTPDTCPGVAAGPPFIAAFELTGTCVWSQPDPTPSSGFIAIDRAGGVVTASSGALTLTKRSTAVGSLVWQISGSGGSFTGVAVDGKGNVYASGTFEGAVKFGAAAVSAPRGFFVLKLSPEGQVASLTGHVAPGPLAMAVAPNGSVALVGIFSKATVDLGGGAYRTGSAPHLVLAELDPHGKNAFTRVLGGVGRDFADPLIAFDASNHLVLATAFEGAVDFGGVTLEGPNKSSKHFDLAVAAIDDAGDASWAMSYASVDVSPTSLVVAPSGAPVVAGAFSEHLALANKTLEESKASAGFVARIAP